MHRKFWLLSLGKASSHGRVLPSCLSSLCAVFSCFHTIGCEAYSFMADGYYYINGIFNVRTDVGACSTHEHEGGSGTNKSALELTRTVGGTENCSLPCPARWLNTGSSYLNSNSLTTELRPSIDMTCTETLWPQHYVFMCIAAQIFALSEIAAKKGR